MQRRESNRFDTRVLFQRDVGTRGALGGRAVPDWTDLFTRFASVTWGTSAERRQASLEQAVQSATLRLRADVAMRGVKVTDRIVMNGLAFDIGGIIPVGTGMANEIEITATAVRG